MDAIPNRVKDLLGQVFGRWTVLGYAGKGLNSRHALWRVQCSCPLQTIKNIPGHSLVGGISKSCGCLRVDTGKLNATHGMSGTPEYEAWQSAKKRTRDPSHPRFKDYGGRKPPVTMSDELYDSFELFFAEVGLRTSPDHSIDRKNNAGGYERGNLKWSTDVEQNRNRRSNRSIEFEGKVYPTLSAISEAYGQKRYTVKNRLACGWSLRDALFTPDGKRMKNPSQ